MALPINPILLLPLQISWIMYIMVLITKKVVGAVFLDLSKAFDCVDSNILIKKLEFYGFHETAIKLLKSFFLPTESSL